VTGELQKQFAYKSVMEIHALPRSPSTWVWVRLWVIKKVLEHAVSDMTKIAGQKPVITKAKKSYRRFQDSRRLPDRLHGYPARTTMYEFLDRLVTIALPRIRDFRGISGKGFDGRGNYNVGFKEQIISRKSSTTRLMHCAV